MERIVLRAATAGFCMGVDLALKKLDRALSENTSKIATYTFGPIIHNPQVLTRYAKRGVQQANTVADIIPPAQVIIRAHGIPTQTEEDLLGLGVHILDATCPKVKKAQVLIADQARLGQTLLLFGEADHPEVQGLLSYAGTDALVFESLAALTQLPLQNTKIYFLAAQTTQDRMEFEAIQAYLRQLFGGNVPVLDTICDATRQRQAEAKEIAAEADYMVVVGGRDSGNTRRLAQVARDVGCPCAHVETEDELSIEDIGQAKYIGLTGGASTPKDIIDRVEDRLKNL